VEAAEHLSLTSIASPMRLLGRTAALLAVELITHHARPTGQRLKVELVVRSSSAGKHGRKPVTTAVAAGTTSLAANRASRS
jgi:DNA-binding LacI/PurR family transcriptional regulator